MNYFLQAWSCENGGYLTVKVPDNVTQSDLYAIKDLVDIIIKHRLLPELWRKDGGRMMDKNEIIERLERLARCAVHTVGELPFVISLDDGIAIHEAIDMLRSQPEPHWIGCSEMLLEDYETKLLTHEVHYKNGRVTKDVRLAYYVHEDDDWVTDEESPEIICYPLAWMPLPELYKGDE